MSCGTALGSAKNRVKHFFWAVGRHHTSKNEAQLSEVTGLARDSQHTFKNEAQLSEVIKLVWNSQETTKSKAQLSGVTRLV